MHCFCKDLTSLPGYQLIPEGCPAWKVVLIEKKNKVIEDNARVSVIYYHCVLLLAVSDVVQRM